MGVPVHLYHLRSDVAFEVTSKAPILNMAPENNLPVLFLEI
jgi:hypothetical protein